MEKATCSVIEFAQTAGVGHNKVREWCRLPDFPATYEGNRFRIHTVAALDWLKRRAESRHGMPLATLMRASRTS